MQGKCHVKKKTLLQDTNFFYNIEQDPLTTFCGTMQVSKRADYCVGYLNLRGWIKLLFLGRRSLSGSIRCV